MTIKTDIKKFLTENKEGIIIGGIVGYIIGKYFLQGTIDLSSVTETQGIIDIISGTTKSTIELAKTKIVLASTIIGSFIGAYIDSILPEQDIKGWFK